MSRNVIIYFLFIFCLLFQTAQAQGENRAEWERGYKLRGDSLVSVANRGIDTSDYSKGGFWQIVVKLMRHEDLDWARNRMDALMENPSGDMFWMHQFLVVNYLGKDQFSPAFNAKMRKVWQTYTPYRGDTENHWAMYYSSLYLISQLYPDDDASTWFTGKSAAENMAEAKSYLISWMELATTIGQGEYDSPDYFPVYIIPMAQLYAWSEDEELKQRAQMMLEWLIADFAIENLDGLYVGAHSRVYPRQVLEQWYSASTAFSWLLFGNVSPNYHATAIMLYLSGFELPEVIYQIATDRSEAYVHKELKRTRHRIRNSMIKNLPVYKYTYMTKEYALGSSQGGLLQPLQQHTWDLTWHVPNQEGAHNTFFSIQPYSNPYEGTMYFAEHWGMVTELIVRSKTTYDSEDKWTGGSPYEQICQSKNTLIALYDFPEDNRFPQIQAFFSKDLSKREVDLDSGWIFAEVGDIYFAYYPLAPYEWLTLEEGGWRLLSPHLKNGGVLHVDTKASYRSFLAFKDSIKSLFLSKQVYPEPSITTTTLSGEKLSCTYGETPKVNDTYIDYSSWKLFESNYLYAEAGSRILTIQYKTKKRVLDFNNLSISEHYINP